MWWLRIIITTTTRTTEPFARVLEKTKKGVNILFIEVAIVPSLSSSS